jgi:hypothetical protein
LGRISGLTHKATDRQGRSWGTFSLAPPLVLFRFRILLLLFLFFAFLTFFLILSWLTPRRDRLSDHTPCRRHQDTTADDDRRTLAQGAGKEMQCVWKFPLFVFLVFFSWCCVCIFFLSFWNGYGCLFADLDLSF